MMPLSRCLILSSWLALFASQPAWCEPPAKVERKAALEFAATIVEASRLVRETYIEDMPAGKLADGAVRGLFRKLDEKIPQDLEQRLNRIGELNELELVKLVADARERLGQRKALEQDRDIQLALDGMLGLLDPFCAYLASTSPLIHPAYNPVAVGLQLRRHADSAMIEVVTPIYGGPAHKAGIRAGDIITRITRKEADDGKPLEQAKEISTKGLPPIDAVKILLGKPETEVGLTIRRAGADKPMELLLTRATVEIETVLGSRRSKDDSWDYWIDAENKIGYVRLTSFATNTARDLEKVLRNLERQGVKGLILDVRFNPGGLLRSAVDVADLFVDDELIVSVQPRVGKKENHSGKREGSLGKISLACLINGVSAGGSEIVAACLQDRRRAVVVGERSAGHASVQNIFNFHGGRLKLTSATFIRPSGKNLNKNSATLQDRDDWGVTPDRALVVNLSARERDALAAHVRDLETIPPRKGPAFTDQQLQRALDHLRGKADGK